ncbi:hypothetical protein N7468_003135 [Penicillium chermesinum]|uniref:C2H2-type zinc finger ascomycetes domain-containing protein n=1 Tax=Penicillium chermesinum TaxID=63820 RepID=A0A9W9P5X0_9EURO|nr:uncharacterized protein N7468_003135 [Penicillium chermesinum]KAJ5238516.1 hypothetical protein N7468_003135 [Penicillium chermesinum]
MDPRHTSASSFYEYEYRHHSSAIPMTMSDSPFSHGPLPIPSRSAMHTVPPPLPPPPRIRDLENGYDAGWLHANSGRPHTVLPPINPNSSLFGGHRRPDSTPRSDRMVVDELEGRQSGPPVSRSPEAQIKIEPPPPTDDGFPNSMAVNSPSDQILKGERNFSLQSVKDSSNAYDQHLLNKIGNSLSPGAAASIGSDNRSPIPSLIVPSRPPSNMPSPGPSEGSTLDVKWHNSPQSGGVSPRSKIGWKEYIEGRSPSVESSAPSVALDYEYMRDSVGRKRYHGTSASREGSISLPSRSNRGSYDQGVFSDIEVDLPSDELAPRLYLDEPARPRQFIIREPTPPFESSRQGMKRRASSPPREPINDDRHTLHVTTSNGDLSQRRTTGQPFTNSLTVNSTGPSSHRALSAASSLSIRTSGSYSSTLSIGGSSMTSLSPYDRPSPGGLSPSSDLDTFHEKSILNPSPPMASIPSLPRVLGASSLEPPLTGATGKVSMPPMLNASQPVGPKLVGLYICDCCPKKPKKFDNPDDLSNTPANTATTASRTKTKPSATKTPSISAVTPGLAPPSPTSKPPSTAPPPQTTKLPQDPRMTPAGTAGEEFPNFPQPDWDRRFEHLTTVHKFGECNNAKKFFRADHFRQHLKHSHAGTSGKWTNILENACMKEEQPPEPRDKISGSGAGSGSLVSNSIEEVMSEQ